MARKFELIQGKDWFDKWEKSVGPLVGVVSAVAAVIAAISAREAAELSADTQRQLNSNESKSVSEEQDREFASYVFQVASDGFAKDDGPQVEYAQKLATNIESDALRGAIILYIEKQCTPELCAQFSKTSETSVEQARATFENLDLNNEVGALKQALETPDLSGWEVQLLYCDGSESLNLARDLSERIATVHGARTSLRFVSGDRSDIYSGQLTYNVTRNDEVEASIAGQLVTALSASQSTVQIPTGIEFDRRLVVSDFDKHFSLSVCLSA